MFPNFRKIYTQFRTEDEERRLANAAVFKFCGFLTMAGVILIGRHLLVLKEQQLS